MTKHFWISNPQTRADGYCINSNGFLNRLNKKYDSVVLTYDEILEIITQDTKEEKYLECKRLFNKKFPQPDEKKLDLPLKEQFRLENILSTHKNL